MKSYRCDLCGAELTSKDLRYIVKINIYAAYDTLEISLEDLLKDHQEEMKELLEKLSQCDPKKLEDDVFKHFNFDLCRSCQQKFIQDPLGEKNRAVKEEPLDIDHFLRELMDG